MKTKLEAAQAAARCGAATVLCNGRTRNAIVRVVNGEATGTLFRSGSRLASRKHWLAFTTHTHGELVLDDGAVRAIERRGKSLLPAGITEVRGRFGIGDSIACVAADGREIARGLVTYSSDDIRRIAGQGTAKIRQMLGYSNGDEVIHRDDLVRVKEDAEPDASGADE